MSLPSSLAPQEPHLRSQLPASLYARLWIDPTSVVLKTVMQHLNTLQYLLSQYLPYDVVENPPDPGQLNWHWQTRTLMFTDLAGFTHLTQTHAQRGTTGAKFLADLLNSYFSKAIDVINTSGGDLLEFTGDAMLVEFADFTSKRSIAKAIRAGLRLQRMMTEFTTVKTFAGEQTLTMRIGLHNGRFLTADVGTPMRMMHILLGKTVRQAKQTETIGLVGRVCITEESAEEVADAFRFESHQPGYLLVRDDFDSDTLGGFDITLRKQRVRHSLLVLNQTEAEIIQEINRLLDKNIPLSSYIAPQVLKLLVENACTHNIPPAFSRSAVLFVNLLGLPEAADHVNSSTEEIQVLTTLSHLFAQINSLVEAKDGFLQEWTYHLYSDILIYFGIPSGHIDDAIRAVKVACQISNLVSQLPLLQINNQTFQITCQIGIDWGIVVAGEIGHSFGRRDYNALGDPVNRAAYIMSQADSNQILMTDTIEQEIACECSLLNIDLPFQLQLTEKMIMKGDKKSISVFTIDALSTQI
ncbi:MAG: adenylate/guanylate cyclase domain-containing protein [Cyanobacteria bacterium P01_A01_bin.123]